MCESLRMLCTINIFSGLKMSIPIYHYNILISRIWIFVSCGQIWLNRIYWNVKINKIKLQDQFSSIDHNCIFYCVLFEKLLEVNGCLCLQLKKTFCLLTSEDIIVRLLVCEKRKKKIGEIYEFKFVVKCENLRWHT